ncbi:MAG: electron transfer flavoprotein subunit alpha/FixB family protein [candidate division WOR-3 bacterium]
MKDCKDVFFLGEIKDGKLESITLELVQAGKVLARCLGEKLVGVLLGHQIQEKADEMLSYGVDDCYFVESFELREYNVDLYLSCLENLLLERKPRIFLLGHTDIGAELGPLLAFRLGTSIVTDCVELSIDASTGRLLRTKPIQGGVAMAVFEDENFPQMATVRRKSFLPAERVGKGSGNIFVLTPNLADSRKRIKVVERNKEDTGDKNLEDAEIIVAGGRGIGDAEGFKLLEELARYLKGALGASRAAVDNGWVPASIQIGITGKIVAPRVYIAVGISGASQHMTGCSRARTIIAINRDPNAPIFRQAHFGVVGDWKLIVPAFLDKLKSLE